MDHRKAVLTHWISEQLSLNFNYTGPVELDVVSGDASFRRYFRCNFGPGANKHRVICVDAPVATENNPAFVKIAKVLGGAEVNVPQVLAVDFEQGLMMLSDLGDQLLRPLLTGATVDGYYKQAMDELIKLMSAQFVAGVLPLYDRALLLREMHLFRDWFCEQYLGLTLTENEQGMMESLFSHLCHQALSQPQIPVHRDYHSRNLMILENGDLGVIDFQDAVYGAITYDLVSLLRDAYVAWPKVKVRQWVDQFSEQLRNHRLISVEDQSYWIWFNEMGVQRHLKVLGIFARLSLRDGKSAYLKDMPLTYSYLRSELQELAQQGQPFMSEFADWLQHRVLPAFAKAQPQLGAMMRDDV